MIKPETKKRWREDALRMERAVALDRPLPNEATIRVAISTLAAHVKCLTIDESDPDEVERYWGKQ